MRVAICIMVIGIFSIGCATAQSEADLSIGLGYSKTYENFSPVVNADTRALDSVCFVNKGYKFKDRNTTGLYFSDSVQFPYLVNGAAPSPAAGLNVDLVFGACNRYPMNDRLSGYVALGPHFQYMSGDGADTDAYYKNFRVNFGLAGEVSLKIVAAQAFAFRIGTDLTYDFVVYSSSAAQLLFDQTYSSYSAEPFCALEFGL